MKGKAGILFWGIVFGALAVRVYHLDLPFMEPYNSVSRQMTSATIARNFYEHGFLFFYPEIDANGPGPYLETAEVPIVPYLIALSYWVVGGVKEWAARLVSVFFSMWFMITVFCFTKKTHGIVAAVVAFAFLAFSPVSVAFSRSIQPDMFMLLSIVSGLYFFHRYTEKRKTAYFLISLLSVVAALWTKPYTLYLLPVIFLMAWEAEGAAIFRKPKYYVYFLTAFLSLAWYGRMYGLSQGMDLNYRTMVYHRGDSPVHFADLFSPQRLLPVLKIFFLHLLTPVGTLLFFRGFFRGIAERKNRFLYVWFWGIAVFLALVWPIFIINTYYLMAFLPVCAIFIGIGTRRILEEPRMRKRAVKLSAFLVCMAVTLGTLFYYGRGLWAVPQERLDLIEAGEKIRQTTPANSLIVASYGSTHALLYYCHRKGWEFSASKPLEQSVPRLNGMIQKGAGYFVTTRDNLRSAAEGFEAYLRARYRAQDENERYVIFRLRG
ncbi:MAG: glycosyltransferase family 39 protein [Candidatus Omnitrophica bacterium]|nr:glycosyltransferase family 39 protein [Candidatus Omnitrophota bacterium]